MVFTSEIFNINFKNSVVYLTFKKFDKINFLKHAFSTKIGGVSTGHNESMNLSFLGDDKQNVLTNYHRFSEAVGLDINSLIASSQKHETFIREVSREHCGIGITRPKDMDSVDGLITDARGVTLVTYYADCVPIFYLDPVKKVIGLAHAGWRGTCALIAKKMVERFKTSYGSDPSDILVGIGPSIGQCCYEVDYPVAEKFFDICGSSYKTLVNRVRNKYYLDLQGINKYLLIESGINSDNIAVTDLCTCCGHELFFSHRATNGKRGTMVAVMQITQD